MVGMGKTHKQMQKGWFYLSYRFEYGRNISFFFPILVARGKNASGCPVKSSTGV